MFKRLFNKLFDYRIVGEYYKTVKLRKGVYAYQKCYDKQYFLRCLNKRKRSK